MPDQDLTARPLNLLQLLNYQLNAVVSRTIVDKPTGTVTVFAFDEGEGLSEHTAPFDAFIHVIEGAALITIAGDEHAVSAGELIIMPADKPHAVRAVTRFKMVLVMIR